MQETDREKSLQMTESEAIGLLEMATCFKEDLTPDQVQAIAKVSELCREFYREWETASATTLVCGNKGPIVIS